MVVALHPGVGIVIGADLSGGEVVARQVVAADGRGAAVVGLVDLAVEVLVVVVQAEVGKHLKRDYNKKETG